MAAPSLVAAVGPGGVVLAAALVALLVTLAVRRLLPPERRHRGRRVAFAFATAAALGLAAIALGVMPGSAGSAVQVAGLLCLAAGLVGLLGLVAFDVVLARLGVAPPPVAIDLAAAAVGAALLIAFLRLQGLDLLSLVTTSAVLGAVVGLALQATIANVFGGISLQLDRTVGRGDWIRVGDRVGRIQEIGWRSTRIVTKDDDTVFVPNGELVTKEVLNYSRPTGRHRASIEVGFHYRHAPRDVCRTLVDVARATPGVLADPPPTCGPKAFGDSAVVYALQYWIADYALDDDLDEELRARIWYAAARDGLEFPYPTRTLLVPPGRNPDGRAGIEAAQPFDLQEET